MGVFKIMEDIQIFTEPTPNPEALKFIVNRELISDGKATFEKLEDCQAITLARDLLSLPDVRQIHFFENVLTVTKEKGDWSKVEEDVKSILLTRLPSHDADFNSQKDKSEQKRRDALTPELRAIEGILDDTVRMGLQADGGDIQILELDGKKLYVRYEGACGTCPSSTTGTLYAIEGILKDRFDPEIEVIPI
jgi:Fe-S cluster biogenesis protein NfuA